MRRLSRNNKHLVFQFIFLVNIRKFRLQFVLLSSKKDNNLEYFFQCTCSYWYLWTFWWSILLSFSLLPYLQIHLQVAHPMDLSMLNGLQLGLDGEHQYINAGLAIALCNSWLQRTGHLDTTYLDQNVSSISRGV